MAQLSQHRQKLVADEFKIWKKNAPLLYDTVLSHGLEWPSITVDWIPKRRIHREKQMEYTIQELILGTHTAAGEQNHLLFAEVKHPTPNKPEEQAQSGYGMATGGIKVIQKIKHPGEPQRARHMPQNPNIVATRSPSEDVLVFDRTRHPSIPNSGGGAPDLTLKGHSASGYGLSWNRQKEGLLLACGDDNLICMWDIQNLKKTTFTMKAKHTFRGHSDVVEDIAWHPQKEDLFVAVDDDSSVIIWDSRKKEPVKTITKAHRSEINCVDWNHGAGHLFATGSADKSAGLWDTRYLKQKLHSFEGHGDEIFAVKWAPFSETILATCSADRRSYVWDISKIGLEQTPADAEDGPPELVFIHGGHTDKISEFAWSPNVPYMIASVADNNIVQIWQMASMVYDDDNFAPVTREADLE